MGAPMSTPEPSPPPVGRSILALICLLVALLALLMAGAKWLVGGMQGSLDDWQAPALALLAITLVYGFMAHGCRSGRPWMNWYAPLALGLLTVVAMADLARNEVLDLASALVFLLAVTANMAVIGYTRSMRKGGGGGATGRT